MFLPNQSDSENNLRRLRKGLDWCLKWFGFWVKFFQLFQVKIVVSISRNQKEFSGRRKTHKLFDVAMCEM